MPYFSLQMFSPSGATFTQTRTRPTNPQGGGGGFEPSSGMPRKRILESVKLEDRAAQRQKLGTLRDLTVQPATRRRYDLATNGFLSFLKDEHKTLPRNKHDMDPLVCEYLEHLWAAGKGRGLACDTLAGLQDMQPNLRGAMASPEDLASQ